MAKKNLTGKRVAILVDEGFEQSELIKPRKALDRVGAQTQIVSPQENEVRGWNIKRWGKSVPVDVPLESADPHAFDALLLPGGVKNPDKLRMNSKAVEFVKHFVDAGKPVAARHRLILKERLASPRWKRRPSSAVTYRGSFANPCKTRRSPSRYSPSSSAPSQGSPRTRLATVLSPWALSTPTRANG